MVGRGKHLSKSVRFNLSKEDERSMYEELQRHDRKVPDDPYGSSGAYIKAAIWFYMMHQEEHENNQLLLDSIGSIVRETIIDTMDGFRVESPETVVKRETQQVISELDESPDADIPSEVSEYLKGFGL